MFSKIVSTINDIVWSPALVCLLLFAGLYFSFRTRFVQIRRLGLMVKALFGKDRDREKKGVSSFEAFCIALSGRVGTGNIVGVATALAFGGPGAIFWMWVVAFFGASTAFMESTLSQLFRFHHKTGYRGGPSCYIEQGLGLKWLGIVFAVISIIGYGPLLSSVQSNGLTGAAVNSFNVSPLAAGITLAVLLGLVIIGGIKSISKMASIITPFMALAYIVVAFIILVINYKAVPGVLASIVTNAFAINPVCGGILGTTVAMGVKRGIFSNEAGQGSGAMASAAADVSHPAKQGLAQAFSVYVDTLLVCTATAVMILVSGTYNIIDAQTGEILVGNAPELGANYVQYTQAAMDSLVPGVGNIFVTVALMFFAFTTLMAYYFYGESSIIYIFDTLKIKGEMTCIRIFRFLMLGAVLFGALYEADTIWKMGDIGIGMLVWVNVIVLFILCPKAIQSLKDYESKIKKK